MEYEWFNGQQKQDSGSEKKTKTIVHNRISFLNSKHIQKEKNYQATRNHTDFD